MMMQVFRFMLADPCALPTIPVFSENDNALLFLSVVIIITS